MNDTANRPLPPRRESPIARLAPVLLGGLLLALVIAAIAIARSGRDREPARAGAFEPPARARPVVALDVLQVQGSTLALGGPSGNLEATIDGKTRIFALRPATAAEVSPGDFVMVAGVVNEVLNFAVRQVVILPASLNVVIDSEGIPRLPSGFAGHETNRDPRERPLTGGRVERVSGTTVALSGRGGEIVTTFGAGTPLFRMVEAGVGDIRPGFRLAHLPAQRGEAITAAAALLVRPQ